MKSKRRTAAGIVAAIALVGIWSFTGDPQPSSQVQRERSMQVAEIPTPTLTPTPPGGTDPGGGGGDDGGGVPPPAP